MTDDYLFNVDHFLENFNESNDDHGTPPRVTLPCAAIAEADMYTSDFFTHFQRNVVDESAHDAHAFTDNRHPALHVAGPQVHTWTDTKADYDAHAMHAAESELCEGGLPRDLVTSWTKLAASAHPLCETDSTGEQNHYCASRCSPGCDARAHDTSPTRTDEHAPHNTPADPPPSASSERVSEGRVTLARPPIRPAPPSRSCIDASKEDRRTGAAAETKRSAVSALPRACAATMCTEATTDHLFAPSSGGSVAVAVRQDDASVSMPMQMPSLPLYRSSHSAAPVPDCDAGVCRESVSEPWHMARDAPVQETRNKAHTDSIRVSSTHCETDAGREGGMHAWQARHVPQETTNTTTSSAATHAAILKQETDTNTHVECAHGGVSLAGAAVNRMRGHVREEAEEARDCDRVVVVVMNTSEKECTELHHDEEKTAEKNEQEAEEHRDKTESLLARSDETAVHAEEMKRDASNVDMDATASAKSVRFVSDKHHVTESTRTVCEPAHAAASHICVLDKPPGLLHTHAAVTEAEEQRLLARAAALLSTTTTTSSITNINSAASTIIGTPNMSEGGEEHACDTAADSAAAMRCDGGVSEEHSDVWFATQSNQILRQAGQARVDAVMLAAEIQSRVWTVMRLFGPHAELAALLGERYVATPVVTWLPLLIPMVQNLLQEVPMSEQDMK